MSQPPEERLLCPHCRTQALLPSQAQHYHSSSAAPPPILTTRSDETQVNPPAQARQPAHQRPTLHAPDEREVQQADDGPQLPAGEDERPELDAGPGDAAPVVVAAEGGDGQAEGQRVERGAERLVEQELGGRVAQAEARLRQRVRLLGLVQRRVVVVRGGGQRGRRGLQRVRWEGGFEELLPAKRERGLAYFWGGRRWWLLDGHTRGSWGAS